MALNSGKKLFLSLETAGVNIAAWKVIMFCYLALYVFFFRMMKYSRAVKSAPRCEVWFFLFIGISVMSVVCIKGIEIRNQFLVVPMIIWLGIETVLSAVVPFIPILFAEVDDIERLIPAPTMFARFSVATFTSILNLLSFGVIFYLYKSFRDERRRLLPHSPNVIVELIHSTENKV